MTAKADRCFELSFEVANKIGGIYTVVSSKARHMMQLYADYLLIGPYFHEKAIHEIELTPPPPHLEQAAERIREKGIIIHFGRWNVPGRPQVALIEYKDFFYKENELKAWYWEKYGIDSYGKGYDFSEPVIFSTAAALFIEELQKAESHKKSIVHCHEWMTGFCGLYLKTLLPKIGFVFTTHATMLGRTLSSHNFNLYNHIEQIDSLKEAYAHNVQEKHLTELAAAKYSDTFTTVSPVTAIECEHFLKRKPDVIVLNGLDLKRFPHYEDISIKHHLVRQNLQAFNAMFFGPYEPVEFKNSVFFYTSGRYEFKNKGIDLLLQSLGKLNTTLKTKEELPTVYCYILIPNGTTNIKEALMHQRNMFYEIRDYIKRNRYSIEKHLLHNIINNEFKDPISKEIKEQLEHLQHSFHSEEGKPLLATHTTTDEENNLILQACRENGLNNHRDDKVKIIYCPFYLSTHDNIFNLHYYEFAAACDLGIFPSRYEPFGYTPLESMAVGVPAITTDASGFGQYIKQQQKEGSGINVIERMHINCEDCKFQLYEKMRQFIELDADLRAKQRYKAYETSRLLDWSILIEHYAQAHEQAFSKVFLQ